MIPVGRVALEGRVTGRDALGVDLADGRPVRRQHRVDPHDADDGPLGSGSSASAPQASPARRKRRPVPELRARGDAYAPTGTVRATVSPWSTVPVTFASCCVTAVAEHHVAREADPRRGWSRSARSRWWRRRPCRRPGAARPARWRSWCRPSVAVVEARVDLEVDVRPAARVAGGKDARERDQAVASGLLHAAQVVLVGGRLRVQGVVAVPVAVPDVDRGAGERRTVVRPVDDRQLDRQRDARGDGRRRAEARADVVAHDAALGEDVRRRCEPSPGNGPAVSSGMTAQLAPVAAVPAALAPAEAPAVAPLGPHPMIVNRPAFRPANPSALRTWRRSSVESRRRDRGRDPRARGQGRRGGLFWSSGGLLGWPPAVAVLDRT